MVIKYPIQKRWPYRPRISRVPSVKYFSTVLWYTINFYDKSADYIRTWIAYARCRFFAFITSPIMDIDPERR